MEVTSAQTTQPAHAPEEPALAWSLGVILRAYEAAIRDSLEALPHGHRGYLVLAEVVHGDQPSQLALAAHLGIDRTVMTYLIDDLVEAGLVERRPNPADRRQRQVVATTSGRRMERRLAGRVRAAEDAVLRSLETDERAALLELLRRVAHDVHGVDAERDLCSVVASWVDAPAT
ncbi:MarR family winged helix-turn-helix transcriptional regulator [Intrasporangium sp.]|uniref:MarR family winged helix-turn-helix transcriptional regulator n=1 Tax=Intrasporangium sp. TaxID=1925024 RepID=UPI00293AA61D|nr:MarR family winged helix-turn-helix transcriptional regulator [Intrasporangium sp.]MDV3220981.1 MarR family winged helix-turn-helix transcriptional regulator [Intrasporangium sp.]